MFSNFYIRTNKEETRMSDIKVIKANVTLNGRNKKRNTDSKRSRLFFFAENRLVFSRKRRKTASTSMGKHIYTPNVLYR